MNFNCWRAACGINRTTRVLITPSASYTYCDGQTVGQFVLVSGPTTRCLLLSDICGFHVLGRPPWREDGSVIYSYSSMSIGSKSAAFMTTAYCLIWDPVNPEGQVPLFISPRNRVAEICHWALVFLFGTSYDSKGYGEGILAGLHTGYCEECTALGITIPPCSFNCSQNSIALSFYFDVMLT
jgi:hypothetical protein